MTIADFGAIGHRALPIIEPGTASGLYLHLILLFKPDSVLMQSDGNAEKSETLTRAEAQACWNLGLIIRVCRVVRVRTVLRKTLPLK